MWLQGKDKTQSCKSNKKTNENFNNYINKQETKAQIIVLVNIKMSEIKKKMFVVALIGLS